MSCFNCVACKPRARSTASEADPIGDLCPVCSSLLAPVGDLGEIVGCGVIEARGGRSDGGGSDAGQLIAGRVDGIIARREFKLARVRLVIESCDVQSVRPRVQAVTSRAPGAVDETVRRRPAQPRSRECSRVCGAFDGGSDRRERRRQRKVRSSPWSAGHAPTWARLSDAG
jgi:hypothetical protein